MGENALYPRDAHAGGNSRACGGLAGDGEQLDSKGNWEQLKASITITREEQLKNLYRQLAELNNAIMGKPEGERFPNAAEADTISKLSNAIKKLETEVGLADIISVFSDLLKWVRTYDSTQAKEITPLLDAFVKSKLS